MDRTKAKFTMPAMTSFPSGMQRLPEKLAENLTEGEDLLLNTKVTCRTGRCERQWMAGDNFQGSIQCHKCGFCPAGQCRFENP